MITFQLFDPDKAAALRELVLQGPWEDGRATAGKQAAAVKNNRQLGAGETLEKASATVLQALQASSAFRAAALPRKILPPAFNRYGGESNNYGRHIDSAIRAAGEGGHLRTDLSCTVFLADPATYEGGELVLYQEGGLRKVKLQAGQAVLYPSTWVHEVMPVTRGERIACFFWVQSMVRSTEMRHVLYTFDRALVDVRRAGDTDATVALTGVYHNLLRFWSDT